MCFRLGLLVGFLWQPDYLLKITNILGEKIRVDTKTKWTRFCRIDHKAVSSMCTAQNESLQKLLLYQFDNFTDQNVHKMNECL